MTKTQMLKRHINRRGHLKGHSTLYDSKKGVYLVDEDEIKKRLRKRFLRAFV